MGYWDSLHTPNARWLAYCGQRILARGVTQLWICSHLAPYLICIPLISEVDLMGQIHGIIFCTPSTTTKNPKIQRPIHAHFPPENSRTPCFKILWISPIKFRTCPRTFQNQHWVKFTLNNPFIGLGSYGFNWLH